MVSEAGMASIERNRVHGSAFVRGICGPMRDVKGD
jgi:hypothetical protein